jgi:hypothetical protein
MRRAYSFGVDTWLVEVDVVLPHDMPLHKAHDVGEALQVGWCMIKLRCKCCPELGTSRGATLLCSQQDGVSRVTHFSHVSVLNMPSTAFTAVPLRFAMLGA